MGCFCIPPPASQVPRKVYNILVPDVFPINPPDPTQELPRGVERKAGKLAEYLHQQPSRTSKVSRRLTRRIKRALHEKQYGYVKIAVYAYQHLLSESTKEGCPYSFTYFSKELVEQPDTVIQTLLTHPDPLVKCLGADLLGSYIAAQDQVDHQMKAVQPLVTRACELARAKGSGEALKLACLRAVRRFLELCHQLRTLPANLDKIEEAVLQNLDSSSAAAGVANGTSGEPGAAGEDESTVPGLARSVLAGFKPFLQDISSVYLVVETLFRYLDQDSHWKQTDAVQRLMSLVQSSCSDQPFPLFTALMRHSSVEGLGAEERAVVINLALQQPSVYSLSAFSLALQELPRALAADPHNDTQLRNTVMAAMRKLALEVGDAGQLCEAISSALRQHPTPSRAAQSCLECALAAALAIPSFPEPGHVFPGGHAPAQLLQQLAAIVTVWGAAANDARTAACELLAAVLPSCGPGIRDEKQALGMMDLVLSMARNVHLGTPGDVVTMDRVVAACLGTRQPELLLHGVRLAKALLQEAVSYAPAAGVAAQVQREVAAAAGVERRGTGDDEADRLWAVALVLLLNNLMAQLASRGNCTPLLHLRFAVPPDACTALQVEGDTPATQRLVATSPLFAGNARSAESALRAVAAEWPVDHWYGKVLDALCKGSVLQTHYMHNLQNVIFEPFTAHALPGLPATQQLVAGGQPPSTTALAVAGASNGGGTGAVPNASPREGVAVQLSSKLEAMARSRVASIRRERLNLQHVMDLLGDGDGEAEAEGQGANGATPGVLEAGDASREGRDGGVLGELGLGRAAGAGEAGGKGAGKGVGVAGVGPGEGVLTLDEVLQVAAEFDALPAALPGPGPLEMSDLVRRLEAVTG